MKKKSSSFKNRLIGSLATLMLTASLSFGQSDTARVEGTVTDSTGAAVAGVTVVLVNTENNSRIEITTNEEGNYVAPTLKVGVYRVEFSAQGFRKNIQNNITLTVSQIAQINAQLDTGEVTDVVEVTSSAPLVETSSSSLGQVIEGKQIVDLPINGRNFTQFATLVPGVSRGTPGSNADGSGGNAETFRQGDTGSAAISANGLREQNNNFLLDGIDNNESVVNTIVFFPPIEALQEFRVITSVGQAEYGRGGGAIINAVTKSGTNEIHGTLFELLRNSELDARATFAPTKPIFQRNQFGFAFGAPIKKDRTFFFGNYQGLRQNLPKEEGNRVTVPTARMRQGDFGELLDPNFTGLGQPITIFDPITGNPFPRNVITRPLDPVAVKYLNSFPLPEIGGRATQNYFVKRIAKQTFNDGDFRIDHRFNDSNTIFGRFSIADDNQSDPGRIPGFQAGFGSGLNAIEARGVASGYTHTFSPTAINEFRFGFTLLRIGFFPVNFGQNQNQNIGIGGPGGFNSNTGISLIGGGNGNFIEYLGDGGQFTLRERSYQVSDALTYIKGNNTFKFGFVVIRRNVKAFQGDFAKGFYFFSDFTATPGNKPPLGQTGYEVADMLVGKTNFTSITASLTGALQPSTAISYENGFYAQDDWRVTRKLTLNVGLRYEYFTAPFEENDRLSNFDPATKKLVIAGMNGPRATVETDKNNLAPRFGLAYAINSKTVLRGGYGIFYALDRGGIANQLTQNAPFIVTQFRFSGPGANVRLSDPIPLPDPIDLNNPVLPAGSALRFIPKDSDTTMVQQYNVTVEHQFNNYFALSAGYVGTKGTNVVSVATSGGFNDANIQNRLTTIANVGDSDYNSFQMKATLRNYKGLGFLASYTYGRANNNTPGPFPGPGGNFRTQASDPNNLDLDEGPADYDVRNRFTFASTYDLPFLKNSSNKVAKTLFSGYQINTIITLQDGTPFTVFGGFGRAALVSTKDAAKGSESINNYYNPAAFRPSMNAQDQAPRNFLRGPGLSTVDFSVFRKFNITEKLNFEFRAQAYNLFNNPQFSNPGIFLGAGDAGVITNTRGNSARQFEFGLRVNF